MVITLPDGAPSEFLKEFAEMQSVSTDEALLQIILPLARIYYHGKNAGVKEVSHGVMDAFDKIEALEKHKKQ